MERGKHPKPPPAGRPAPTRTGEGAAAELASRLIGLEGASYPAYRSLKGPFDWAGGTIELLHVQPDPFAPPSRLMVTVPLASTGLEAPASPAAPRVAAEDFFGRAVHAWLHDHPDVGSVVEIDPPAQQVLRRTALTLHRDRIELLLSACLPARGRRIEGRRAARALAEGLPRLVREVLERGAWDGQALHRHEQCVADHAALRSSLSAREWVAFVADGSILARRSGEEDTPLREGAVVFQAPESLAAEVDLPHAGRIRGLAIPRGITLLCGGGFHGKSTLLRALAVAVYPHVPGDGRERVACDPTAMMVRAEDGRAVTAVDLRAFLHDLPGGIDPSSFTTRNASGSTSQAAGIVEALEAGCRCLLMDEDTSATNFLLRDPWMARLLRPDQEPIVPLVTRLREIFERFGASTILVAGGSGEAFRVADRVLVMDRYRPSDASASAAAIRSDMGAGLVVPPAVWPDAPRRLPLGTPGRRSRIRALGVARILLGASPVDLGASGALVHPSQARTLAGLLAQAIETGEENRTVPDIVGKCGVRLAAGGPAASWRSPRGDLAEVRPQEIAMLLSRLRYAEQEDAEAEEGTPGGV